MAFLTKYNLSQLCQSLEINTEVSLDMFLKHIYNDNEIFSILNKREIEYLFKYKMLLNDEVKFIVKYYKEIPEKLDTKNFVFNKGGKMKYHLISNCKLIVKDYLDFNIPEEIKDKGDDAIKEYRDWFNTNNFGEKYRKKDIDKNQIIFHFNAKYPKKYGIKLIEDNSNILIIEQPNSTNENVDFDYNFEKVKAELSKLKLDWQYNFPCKTTRIIAKFKYLVTKSDKEINDKISELFSDVFISNFGLDNLKQQFKLSKIITNQIITLILEHIKWTYNLQEKNFDYQTLEKFGLECCSSCSKEVQKNGCS